MKKLIVAALATAMLAPVFAAEKAAVPAIVESDSRYAQEFDTVWPSPFAFCEWPKSPVIVGMRLTIPFSTCQEMVTGLDLGLWGRCRDFEGLQINILRNDVKDTLSGFQIGLYNSANRADLFCIQVGLFNETQSFRGIQAGLINVTGSGEGFQVGIVNSSESFHGYQVGLVNVIRDSEVPMLPVVNIGF